MMAFKKLFTARQKEKRKKTDNQSFESSIKEKNITQSSENTTSENSEKNILFQNHQDEEFCKKSGEAVLWKNKNEDSSINAKDIHRSFVEKHADEDLLFRCEFEKIPEHIRSFGFPSCEHATKTENKDKNRYKNVLTTDNSRVKLSVQNDDPNTDYINATYIDGYDCKNKFIATQGPKPGTVDDFWRMIWEKKCYVVVMIANVVEAARKKCEIYWPNECESSQYGYVNVTNQKEITHGTFVRRILKVSHSRNQNVTREVSQFQFLVWPDHGVPKSTSDIFRFRDRTLEAQPNEDTAGPILVHCSAGVGRTGTYIGLDVLMQELHGTGKIDPLTLVVNFRLRRTEMVQSLDQYVLLHKLIDEWRTLGKTEFTRENFQKKFEKLVSTGGIVSEFKRVINCQPLHTKLGKGWDQENIHKNRDLNIVPYRTNEVEICRYPSDPASRYYNASLITTYDQTISLIAAQGPMKNTCEDFWRLIVDNCVSVIIMLNTLDIKNPEKDFQYWPKKVGENLEIVDDSNTKMRINVSTINGPEKHPFCDEIVTTKLIVNQYRIDQLHQPTTWKVIHIQYRGWNNPDHLPPQKFKDILLLRKLMLEKLHSSSENIFKPLVLVHCTNGCGRTGVFCSFNNTSSYLENEKLVDVSRSVKDLRDSRPHMVQTENQYRLCYELVSKYINLMCNQTDSSSTSSEDNLKPKHEPIDLMSDLKDYVGESKDDFNLEKAYSGLQVHRACNFESVPSLNENDNINSFENLSRFEESCYTKISSKNKKKLDKFSSITKIEESVETIVESLIKECVDLVESNIDDK